MLPFDQALELVVASACALPSEPIPLSSSVSRILAADVLSAVSIPRFANSQMDGYAVRSIDPSPLTLRATVAAGDASVHTLTPGDAIAIMTGAPLPTGADAVIRIEDTTRTNNRIAFLTPVSAHTFVRTAGTDYSPGMLVAAAGSLLTPERIMAIACVGIASVTVKRAPRVTIIPTGRELVIPGDPLPSPASIWNASTDYLHAALSLLGCSITVRDIVRDDPAAFTTELERSRDADVILTTGAVSMGEHDFVPAALTAARARIVFHKMATRPAKPTLFATLGNTAIFGLAGNPISTVIGMRFLVTPYLRRLLGLPAEVPRRMTLVAPQKKPHELKCFYKCNASESVTLLAGQDSHLIRPLTEANAWAVTGQLGERVTDVDVYPLTPSF